MASEYLRNTKFNGRNVSFPFLKFLYLLLTFETRADLHDLVVPHLYHLRLTPQHLSSTTQRSPQSSPYTPHILALLAISFFPLLFVIHLPLFPIREVCWVIGLLPFVVAHPYVRAALPVLLKAFVDVVPFLFVRLGTLKDRTLSRLRLWKGGKREGEMKQANQDDGGEDGIGGEAGNRNGNEKIPLPLSMVVRRLLDDDRLNDKCWNSELREVQLWENERFGGMSLSCFHTFFVDAISFVTCACDYEGPIPPDSPTLMATTMGLSSSSSFSTSSSSTAASGLHSSHPQKGWSKQNLRPGERSAWTRGRDGWSGVEGSSGGVRWVFFSPGFVFRFCCCCFARFFY